MPAWVQSGVDDYARRLKGAFRFELLELAAGRRGAGTATARALADESQRLLATLAQDEHVVALDERGGQKSTRELAQWLGRCMQQGRDVALLIGGPDGLAAPVLTRATERWSLSQLTLPHAMVRVIVAEQLYRAHTLLINHPYHRE